MEITGIESRQNVTTPTRWLPPWVPALFQDFNGFFFCFFWLTSQHCAIFQNLLKADTVYCNPGLAFFFLFNNFADICVVLLALREHYMGEVRGFLLGKSRKTAFRLNLLEKWVYYSWVDVHIYLNMYVAVCYIIGVVFFKDLLVLKGH